MEQWKNFVLYPEMGRSSVLVGDPAYYHRFGLKASVNFGIRNKNDIPDEYVMACELVSDALSGISGTIDFYEKCTENA